MLMDRFPMIEDLAARARLRVPRFALTYLESGTGDEVCLERNRAAFGAVELVPNFMKGALQPELSTTVFGQSFAAPFGVAPIGMASLLWPGMEMALAGAAKRSNIPFSLSTVAAETIENVGQAAGANAWFQLYPPRDKAIRDDLIARAKASGYSALMVTCDVPVPSRREKMRRLGLTMPPKMTPSLVYSVARCPDWARAVRRRGKPRFLTLERYVPADRMAQVATFVGEELSGNLTWDYLAEVRAMWDGPLLLKGVLSTSDAGQALSLGVDGLVVSNHGGRQLDAAPSPLSVLGAIRDRVGPEMPIIVDSGVRSGLDIVRALCLGANFVLLGRAFLYGVAALGEKGGDHVIDILTDEMRNVMIQIGAGSIMDLNHDHVLQG